MIHGVVTIGHAGQTAESFKRETTLENKHTSGQGQLNIDQSWYLSRHEDPREEIECSDLSRIGNYERSEGLKGTVAVVHQKRITSILSQNHVYCTGLY